jgi:ubiquinone/menaquinone biosynthesis C-methylase UbiE
MDEAAGREIETNSPLSMANIEHVLGDMDLAPSQRVIDVGCGNGAILVRAAEQKGISGVGIDVDAAAVAAAVEMAHQRGVGQRLTFQMADASAFPFDASSFDAALCIGSCHALGGYRAALTSLRRVVRPGGFVTVGELHWRREPAEAYLAVLGEA